MAKISLEMKARRANGKDRICGKCNHFPCPEAMKKVCDEAFIRGYKKGYKQANGEQKKEQQIAVNSRTF